VPPSSPPLSSVWPCAPIYSSTAALEHNPATLERECAPAENRRGAEPTATQRPSLAGQAPPSRCSSATLVGCRAVGASPHLAAPCCSAAGRPVPPVPDFYSPLSVLTWKEIREGMGHCLGHPRLYPKVRLAAAVFFFFFPIRDRVASPCRSSSLHPRHFRRRGCRCALQAAATTLVIQPSSPATLPF